LAFYQFSCQKNPIEKRLCKLLLATTGGTTSQGFDLGAWLLRNCYDVCEMQAQSRLQRSWSNTGSEVQGFAEVEWMWQCTSWLNDGRLGLVAMDFRQMAWAMALCWIDGSMAGCNL